MHQRKLAESEQNQRKKKIEQEISDQERLIIKAEAEVNGSEKEFERLKHSEEEMLQKLTHLQKEQQKFELRVKKLNNAQGLKLIDIKNKTEEVRASEEAIRKFSSTNSADHEKQLKKAQETAKQDLAET